jgi:autotransporter-associated beta strand protein
MNLPKTILSSLAAIVVMTTLAAQAQIYDYKTNNNDALTLATSWTNGVAPTALDTVIWDHNVSTPANCSNTFSGTISWGGIQILDPAAPVKVTSTGTINLGAGGMDLSGSAKDLWLACSVNTANDQIWSVASGRTLALGDTSRNVQLQNNVTINGHVTYINTFRVTTATGTLTITNSATTIEPDVNALPGALFVVGNTANLNTVNQTAGAVKVKNTSGTTGSPASAMTIGSAGSSTGIYTITGGTLSDITSGNVSYLLLANGAGSSGTLNVDGTGSVQAVGMRMANSTTATATVNLTNGTITLAGTGSAGEFDIGRSASYTSATVNVYGGTLSVSGGTDLPHGGSPGFLNISGGNVYLTSMNCAAAGTTGNGTLTISGGSLTVTNGINLPNGAVGTGTVNLNGGTLTVSSVAHPGTASGTLNFNGGTLKSRGNSATFIATNITVNVGANAAIIDTTNNSVTILSPLLNGGGTDGGLTKFGTGTLTIGSSAGTYNGPTVVNAGTLAMSTTNHTGGSIVVSNLAGLQATYANATTMNCSSLALGTLGASSNGTNYLTFNLGTGNPANPVINASSLAATGTVNVAVSGSGFSIGTIHLIQYSGSLAGNDFVFTNTFLSGAVGYVTNNTGSHFVDLVITALPNLVWRAQVNTNWDINTTANWVDLSSSLASAYPDGASVTFNDSASNTVVNLTNTVSPASVTLNNVNSNYIFGGGGRISGATGLTKTGAGTVTMALTNIYNGATVISNGTFVLGVPNAIPGGGGRGNVTLEGKLDLAGFSDSINGLTGSSGKVDNSSANPVLFSIGGGGGVGVFAGVITNSGGALTLNVTTGGSEQLLSKNGYSGSTTNAGNLQLAYEQSISPAPLTLRGGSLYWVDTAPHTITNQITMSGGNAIGAPTNGLTTIANVVNLVGGIGITCNSDVLLAQGATNGPASGLTGKSGPGTLTLNNAVGDWSTATFQLNLGRVIFNGGAIIQDGNNFRIQCNTPNGLAYCLITNGATITLSNSATSNVRIGDSGDAAGGTNQIDLAGTLTVIPQSSPNTGDKFQFDGPTVANSPPDVDIANLLPGGVLNVRQVAQANGVTGIFNFNGGMLRANTNDFGPTFMTGLSAGNVLDGGAIIDDGGYTNITIGQSLQAGGTGIGGLTKQGSGALILTGQSTYTGNTLVNAGTLAMGAKITFPTSYGSIAFSSNIIVAASATLDVTAVVAATGIFDLVSGQTIMGKGAVAGVMTVDSGATVAPGDFVSTGTLTFTNAPVLSGAVQMRLYKSGIVATNDQLVVASADTLQL